MDSSELPWSIQPEQLAAAIVSLIRYGWPPSLILMYDEVWAIIQQASALMRDATGGNACNMDILAWWVGGWVDVRRGGREGGGEGMFLRPVVLAGCRLLTLCY